VPPLASFASIDVQSQPSEKASGDGLINEEEKPLLAADGGKTGSKATMKQKAIHVMLFMAFVSHFEVSNKVLTLFQPCDHGFMATVPYIACDWVADPSYRTLMSLAIFFAITFVAGIPILFAIVLFKFRNAIKNHETFAVRLKLNFALSWPSNHQFRFPPWDSCLRVTAWTSFGLK